MSIRIEKRSTAGFSLIEVIVALVVAATMVIAYISLAERSLFMVEGTRSIWENVNFAQEFLGRNSLSEFDSVSAMYSRWEDRKDAQWKVAREKIDIWDDLPPDFGSIVQKNDEIPAIHKYTLDTKLEDSQLSWVWYVK